MAKIFPNDKPTDVFLLRKTKGDVSLEMEVEGRHLPFIEDSMWTTHNDGSLRINGVEYVNNGPQKLENVPDVLSKWEDALVRNGSIVYDSERTSVHVHMNMQKRSFKDILKGCVAYYILENALMNHCGPSRKQNLFCLPMKQAKSQAEVIAYFAGDPNARTPRVDTYRYSALNLMALMKFGSIESRAMRGNYETEHLTEWATSLYKIFERAEKRFKSPMEVLDFYYGRSFKDYMSAFLDDKFIDKLSSYDNWDEDKETNQKILANILYKLDFDKQRPIDQKAEKTDPNASSAPPAFDLGRITSWNPTPRSRTRRPYYNNISSNYFGLGLRDRLAHDAPLHNLGDTLEYIYYHEPSMTNEVPVVERITNVEGWRVVKSDPRDQILIRLDDILVLLQPFVSSAGYRKLSELVSEMYRNTNTNNAQDLAVLADVVRTTILSKFMYNTLPDGDFYNKFRPSVAQSGRANFGPNHKIFAMIDVDRDVRRYKMLTRGQALAVIINIFVNHFNMFRVNTKFVFRPTGGFTSWTLTTQVTEELETPQQDNLEPTVNATLRQSYQYIPSWNDIVETPSTPPETPREPRRANLEDYSQEQINAGRSVVSGMVGRTPSDTQVLSYLRTMGVTPQNWTEAPTPQPVPVTEHWAEQAFPPSRPLGGTTNLSRRQEAQVILNALTSTAVQNARRVDEERVNLNTTTTREHWIWTDEERENIDDLTIGNPENGDF